MLIDVVNAIICRKEKPHRCSFSLLHSIGKVLTMHYNRKGVENANKPYIYILKE